MCLSVLFRWGLKKSGRNFDGTSRIRNEPLRLGRHPISGAGNGAKRRAGHAPHASAQIQGLERRLGKMRPRRRQLSASLFRHAVHERFRAWPPAPRRPSTSSPHAAPWNCSPLSIRPLRRRWPRRSPMSASHARRNVTSSRNMRSAKPAATPARPALTNAIRSPPEERGARLFQERPGASSINWRLVFGTASRRRPRVVFRRGMERLCEISASSVF